MNSVLVVGAGTMGAGISEVVARAGLQVDLYDVEARFAESGLARIRESLGRAADKGKITKDAAEEALRWIEPTASLERVATADMVIEAAPEDMALKRTIFADLSARSETAVLATNTSSLSVTEIASVARRPERVIGLHFFNPVPVMSLVEIVRAEQTSDETVAAARALVERLGKTAIVVMDSPGFASSRLGIALGLEAIRMLESGVASAADIDTAMKLGYRHPMGPLELTDLVGLDVRLAIADHLAREVGPQFAAPPLLRRLVRAGKLGKKSGEGFYVWKNGEARPKNG